MASAKSVTAVIPCFPYAREPDAPYKRNGMPRARVPSERSIQERVLALAADRLQKLERPSVDERKIFNSPHNLNTVVEYDKEEKTPSPPPDTR